MELGAVILLVLDERNSCRQAPVLFRLWCRRPLFLICQNLVMLAAPRQMTRPCLWGFGSSFRAFSLESVIEGLARLAAEVSEASTPPPPRLTLAVGQNQWYHFGVGAPPILEPMLVVGLGCSLDFGTGF